MNYSQDHPPRSSSSPEARVLHAFVTHVTGTVNPDHANFLAGKRTIAFRKGLRNGEFTGNEYTAYDAFYKIERIGELTEAVRIHAKQ